MRGRLIRFRAATPDESRVVFLTDRMNQVAESRGRVVELAIVILAAAVYLRVAGLFTTPLWLDEAYSAYAVEHGLTFTWTVVPTYEAHPPLYYTLLWVWSLLASDSLAGLRSLGVLCGLITMGTAAVTGWEIARARNLDSRFVGVAAAALVGFSPLMIDMSREVRPYPMMILAYAIGLAAMLRASRLLEQSKRLARAPFVVYLIALETSLWLHNVGPLFGGSLTLAFVVLVWGKVDRADTRLIVVGHIAVGAFYVPGLLMLLDQATTWTNSTWLVFRWTGLHWKLAALWGMLSLLAVVAAVVLLASALNLTRDWSGLRVIIALLIAAVVPAALSIILSVTVTPVFLLRTLTPVSVPALVLLAVGVGRPAGKLRWLTVVALLVILSQMIFFDVNARRAGPKEDWYTALKWLHERFEPGDVVYGYPNEGLLPFDRAAGDLGLAFATRAIPVQVPALDVGTHPTGYRGAASLPREMLHAIAEEPATKSVRTIWLLRVGPWTYDAGDAFLEELSRERVVIDRWQSGAIDIAGLRGR